MTLNDLVLRKPTMLYESIKVSKSRYQGIAISLFFLSVNRVLDKTFSSSLLLSTTPPSCVKWLLVYTWMQRICSLPFLKRWVGQVGGAVIIPTDNRPDHSTMLVQQTRTKELLSDKTEGNWKKFQDVFRGILFSQLLIRFNLLNRHFCRTLDQPNSLCHW